jgi:hypothetical protein
VVTNTIFCIFCSADPCNWTTEAFLRRNVTSAISTASTTVPELPPANGDGDNGTKDDEWKATTIQFKGAAPDNDKGNDTNQKQYA